MVAAAPIDCYTDIIFVLDQSGSISSNSFNQTKLFLAHLVVKLDIDRGYTQVGFLSYSSRIATTINLNAYSATDMLQIAIYPAQYHGGSANTAAALEHVRTTMLTPEAGDRSDVPNTVVVLTGGNSDNRTATKVSINYTFAVNNSK